MTRTIPWPRIVAEGAAICVSILLAFAIDAWWDQRQDRVEEAQALLSLQDEFEVNRDRLAQADSAHRRILSEAGTLVEAIGRYKRDRSDPPSDSLLTDFLAPEYTEVHNNVRYPVGLDGAREHVLGVRRTFPDLHLTVEQQIAEEEWVATRVTARGRHEGVWLGMKPTGRKVEMTAVNLDRVVDGRIVDLTSSWLTERLGLGENAGSWLAGGVVAMLMGSLHDALGRLIKGGRSDPGTDSAP